MTEQQSPEWGAPQPAEPAEQSGRPAWNVKKTVAAVAIAVAIAGAGGVAIYAASGTNQQTGAGGMGPGGMGGAPPDSQGGMRGGFGLGTGTTTHGEFQTGEVTAISDSSVEVKSTDGYTKTYVVDADTVAEGVEKGDTVTVIATTEDGKSVASSVVEPGQRGQRAGQAPPAR
ncbi:hypothetical protein [Lentzea flaviverrucosa]|uniref:DUF5666 domain-containing protein n=1 Tax=Lentzea flaviverrucosa TaxID=200379 RepID=A0A1H9XW15_9PSEU|nr:hypothetical protein [Lentzea flaviverrucosa]RDI18332.1 hypothetical protein DFR72_119126 [Lentzea flaviverrucosa]SES50269.1 hypothetical protein SAMN05216195_119126 [Lentzea flaviverrucosa]